MTIRKISLIFVFIFFVSIHLYASDSLFIGISGGYVYNKPIANTGYRDNVHYDIGHGFEISIPIKYKFNDWFGIETGIEYATKSYKWSHRVYQQEQYAYTDWLSYTNHFMEIPFTFDFSLGNERIRSVTSFGGYIGVWIMSQREGALYAPFNSALQNGEYQVYVKDNKAFNNSDNRFEAGLLFRTGFEVSFEPALFFLRTTFSLGLTDLNRNYQKDLESRYNNSIKVETGILIQIGGAK